MDRRYKSILVLAGVLAISGCGAQSEIEPELCANAIADPITAMLNILINDKNDEHGFRSKLGSDPIYVDSRVRESGCNLGTTARLADSDRHIYFLSQEEQGEIVNSAGWIKLFKFWSITYLDDGRVELHVAFGVIGPAGDRPVWNGCDGPAQLINESGDWKLVSWARHRCT